VTRIQPEENDSVLREDENSMAIFEQPPPDPHLHQLPLQIQDKHLQRFTTWTGSLIQARPLDASLLEMTPPSILEAEALTRDLDLNDEATALGLL
jgi:hypothetical protein